MEPIDDHLLAGFLAGTLPADQRARVVRYLADNGDAREVLALAGRALDAAGPLPAAPARRPADRPARERVARRAPVLRRALLAVVLLFGGGAGLRLAFGPPADQLRATVAEAPLRARVADDGTVTWGPLAGAARYEVVVYDPAEARVVARAEATAPATDAAFAADLRTRLTPGRTYEVRVDAFSPENRQLRSSERTPFTAR